MLCKISIDRTCCLPASCDETNDSEGYGEEISFRSPSLFAGTAEMLASSYVSEVGILRRQGAASEGDGAMFNGGEN